MASVSRESGGGRSSLRRSSSRRQRHVGIVSRVDDLHALIIQNALSRYADMQCSIVASDRICGSSALTWSTTDDVAARLPVRGGGDVEVRDLDVIWWRRVGHPQQVPSVVTDLTHVEVINNDCRGALLGILLNVFQGTWINHPIRSQVAENKLVQLQAAGQAGLRVPKTLVSQDPGVIRRFCEQHGYNVVVKSLHASRQRPLFTTRVTPAHLQCDDSVALSPAIYQEYIAGTRHVRAQCFGERVYAAQLTSDALDWRADREMEVSTVQLSEDVQRGLIEVLKLLGLTMGVIDLKLTPDGEPIFLEVNPQGQFLFVEGLGGPDLTSPFCDFLHDQAIGASA